MTTIGSTKNLKGSATDLEEKSAPQPSSRKPASTRRAALEKQPSEDDTDELTPEEAYLLKVYLRYRDPEAVASTSPGPSSSPPIAKQLPAKPSGITAPNDAKSSTSPVSAATDAISRAKMILMEKKRKAAAAGLTRVGSAAAAGTGGMRKAKMNKITGALSSAATVMLDPLKLLSKAVAAMAEMEASPQEEMANPQGMKVFTVERPGLPEDFVSFPALCEVQSSPLVFAPNLPIVWGPLQWVENDGDQEYVPTEPLVKTLKSFGLAEESGSGDGSGGGGKAQFNETLVMRVTAPAHSQSWGINLCPSKHEEFSQVLFHFNPRRRFVAMNSRQDNVWGQQEKHMPGPKWPDLFNVSINMAIQIDDAGFHIAIDGKYCATFRKRKELPTNGEDLILEIMTADDYGTNLGLIVHEIWWGHKQTMPGRPGASAKERQSARATDPWRNGHDDDTFVDLHVGNLPAMPSPEEQEAVRTRLNDIFQPYGAIQVRVLHREKSFGFIKFRDHNGAAKALEDLREVKIHGRTASLSKAASSSR